MKKKLVAMLVAFMLVFSLAACGKKSKSDVVGSLSNQMEKMSGYKADATLTINNGNDPQQYEVVIWHKKPSYYRVQLKNAKSDQNQIILRNKEGVFVLTPALNKSYRFQSDWPSNSSQPYLPESLVKDLVQDKDASFKSTKKGYIFETKTNYTNRQLLPTQEITFNKKGLTPQSVKLLDSDKNVVLDVKFEKVKYNAQFDKDAFDVKKNMTSARLSVPTSTNNNDSDLLVTLYPNYLMKGVTLEDQQEVKTENGVQVILSYKGNKSFTLIEEKSRISETGTTMEITGEPVDLGHTVGALADKMITWSFGGTDFTIVSKNLTQSELIQVAQSVGQTGTK
ncbi:outer membrane lipoprotein carrier protein LolA [Bacillus sp. EAC]|uniref:LolA family protein n=1 Tax=Bacillus sp. EAC TaxID=1978338 RepID=UPI000B43694A|nr:outer membrane lipoprotein carrier protein LolA [Bacillus sp. EAC]